MPMERIGVVLLAQFDPAQRCAETATSRSPRLYMRAGCTTITEAGQAGWRVSGYGSMR